MEPLLPETRRDAALDVVGIGECSLDHVALVERFPAPGEKQSLAAYRRMAGGQVATAMLACARLGLRAALVAGVGDDEGGELALAPLREAGVDLRDVHVIPGAVTRLALILVERVGGERTVLGHRDPSLTLPPSRLDTAAIVRGRALHLDASDPELATWAARAARGAGVPVFLDADRDGPAIRELLALDDFPVISQGLARALGGSGREVDGLRVLAELGARYPVVTLGERGALAGAPDAPLHAPAFAVEVRDTTGAGDAFHAAFLAAALEGRSGPEAVRFANAAAALNCCGLGAQGGLPTRKEVDGFLPRARPRR